MKRCLQVVVVFALLLAQLTGSALAAPSSGRLAQGDDEIDAVVAEIKTTIPLPYHETFRADSGWTLAGVEGGEALYTAGAYHLYSPGASAGVDPTVVGVSDQMVTDFMVEVDAFPPTDQRDYAFGIAFRYTDPSNTYFFGRVNNEGEDHYQLLSVVDGTPTVLVDQPAADADAAGAVLALSVIAEGDTIALLANGQLVEKLTDESFLAGGIGLAALGVEEVAVSFDDFQLWRAEELATGEEGTGERNDAPIDLAAIHATDPLFIDDFSAANGWYDQSEAGVDFSYTDERFQIVVADADLRAFSGNEEAHNLADDYLLEVDVQGLNQEETYDYGLVFRAQDTDNYLFFGLRGVDTYVVIKVVDGEASTVIESATEVAQAEEAPVYRLGLLLAGADYTFLVNDDVVATITDDTFATGSWSLFVQSTTTGDVGASFDNLSLWALPALTPAPEPTPAAEPTPEPTPEAPALTIPDPAAVTEALETIYAADPVFSDEFRRDSGAWSTLSDGSTSEVRDRAYVIEVTAENVLAHSSQEEVDALGLVNYLVEVDAEYLAGSPDSNYGLLFRQQDASNYYAFTISGNYFQLARLLDDKWEILIDYTESTAVESSEGAINRLGVLVVDDVITLLINGTGVAEWRDDALTEGSVGLAAGTFDDGGATVSFDNFDLWTLE